MTLAYQSPGSGEGARPTDAVPSQKVNRRHRPCHRNGIALQAVQEPQQQWQFVPYDHVSNARAHVMLAQLAVPSFQSSTYNPRAWLRSVQESVAMSGIDEGSPRHLSSLIQRCGIIRNKEVGSAGCNTEPDLYVRFNR